MSSIKAFLISFATVLLLGLSFGRSAYALAPLPPISGLGSQPDTPNQPNIPEPQMPQQPEMPQQPGLPPFPGGGSTPTPTSRPTDTPTPAPTSGTGGSGGSSSSDGGGGGGGGSSSSSSGGQVGAVLGLGATSGNSVENLLLVFGLTSLIFGVNKLRPASQKVQ